MSLIAILQGFGSGTSLTIVMGNRCTNCLHSKQCFVLSAGKKLAPWFVRLRAWQGLDCLIAVISWALALGLILKP